MIAFIIVAGLLGGGLLAAVIVRLQKRHEAAVAAIYARQRALAAQLAKVEAVLAEKAPLADVRHLAMMVDGVASIGRRVEDRVSELETPAKSD